MNKDDTEILKEVQKNTRMAVKAIEAIRIKYVMISFPMNYRGKICLFQSCIIRQ